MREKLNKLIYQISLKCKRLMILDLFLHSLHIADQLFQYIARETEVSSSSSAYGLRLTQKNKEESSKKEQ